LNKMLINLQAIALPRIIIIPSSLPYSLRNARRSNVKRFITVLFNELEISKPAI